MIISFLQAHFGFFSAKNSPDQETLYSEGVTLFHKKNYREALEKFKAATRLSVLDSKEEAICRYSIASCLQHLFRLEDALDAALDSLDIRNRLYQKGLIDVSDIKKGLEKVKFIKIQHNMSDLKINQADFNKTYVESLRLLGSASLTKKKYQKALEKFTIAAESCDENSKENALCGNSIAWCFIHLGKYAEAIDIASTSFDIFNEYHPEDTLSLKEANNLIDLANQLLVAENNTSLHY